MGGGRTLIFFWRRGEVGMRWAGPFVQTGVGAPPASAVSGRRQVGDGVGVGVGVGSGVGPGGCIVQRAMPCWPPRCRPQYPLIP